MELSDLHHDCLQSLVELAVVARGQSGRNPFQKIVVITREASFRKLSANFKTYAQQQSVEFQIFASKADSKTPSGIADKIAFQEVIKREIWKEAKERLRFRSGDFVIFVTAEMFMSPLLFRIAAMAKLRGAKVIPEVHNVFIYFPSVIKPDDVEAIRNFYLSGYEIVVDKFGKIGKYAVLVRKKYLNDFTRRVGRLADGFILPSIHMVFPKVKRPVMRLLTRFPTDESLSRRKAILEQLAESDEVVFTVPGQVSEKRRNYDEVLDALTRLSDKKFKMVLLGRLTSHEVARRIRTLPARIRAKVLTFENFIDEETYQDRLLRSHYILMPIFFPYGRFKTTGAIGDAIQMGIPMILPEHAVPQKVIPHKSYRKGELADLLAELMDLSNYKSVAMQAIQFSERFTIDKMADAFNRFLWSVEGHGGPGR